MNKIILVAICLALSACGTTLKATKPDENGYFKTETKISKENILVSKDIDLSKYKQMMYVQVTEDNEQVEEFFKSSIENANVFDRVVVKSDMEQLILNKGLTDKVTSVSDLIGLHHAQKHLGDFLVGKLLVKWEGGYNFNGDLQVIDPEDGQVLFHVTHTAFNWDGLDQPLFYPLLNAFIDWTKEQQRNCETC
jgi:hypothetical protein